MHLFLAFFWIAVAVVFQIYWETLQRHAFIPVSRNFVSFVFFVLFSYNFIRWRMARTRRQAREDAEEPPPRPQLADRKPDPTFDFSKPDSKDGDDKKPN